MHLTRTHAGRVTALLFAAEAVLLLLAGCSQDKQAGAPPPDAVVQKVWLPGGELAETPAARPMYGRRSDKEIEAILKGAVKPGPVPTYTKELVPSWSNPDRGVVGEEAWNVPITREWRHIVIHHSASPTGNAAIFNHDHIFRRHWECLGYDFVIGNGTGSPDGAIEVGRRWTEQMTGAHAGNVEYNEAGIGICLVGDFDVSYPTQAQWNSLLRLVRFLQVKTGIPTCEIIGHRNVPNRSTECPGKHFDLEKFKADLGGGAIGVPIHIVKSLPAYNRSPQVAHAPNSSSSLP